MFKNACEKSMHSPASTFPLSFFSKSAVNHITYPRGLTSQGTTACNKREIERIFPEVRYTMDKLMNLYNPTAGSEVPNMRGVVNYVVLISPKRTKQPAERIGIVGENPKVYKRRSVIEFGIARNIEVSGRRRIHSTRCIYGKGSSLFTSKVSMLAGIDYVEELEILKSRLDKGEKANNLSRIMSDPNFLIARWVQIKSSKSSKTLAFDGTLDEIKMEWFDDTAFLMRKGGYNFAPVRRTYVPKSNKKLRSLTIPSSKDKIVQEGMRFLLELIYEPLFSDCSYAWRPGRGCHDALKKIRMQCKAVSWYIEGDIDQQFPTIDHHILVSFIQEKIQDQAFLDLIFKYIRIGFGETANSVTSMKIGLIQGDILSPILANIYMHPFDEWIMNDLKVRFDSGLKRQKNKEYWRQYAEAGRKAKNKHLRSTVVNDPNWKRLWYYRYADDFIIGVDGSKLDAIRLKDDIRNYLNDRLKLTLNDNKTLITHAETNSADFLGYRIHRTPLSKMPVKRCKLGRKTRIVPRPILDSPIRTIVKKLIDKGYVKPNLQPTRNSRFINLKLFQIIEHYKTVERGICNYYSLANNYGNLVGRVHFLLKYSCVLTIASKMGIKTMKGVFRKYGKNLSVKSEKGVVTYPTPSYKRPI
jgi:group II intron reverse transcriptase/maturase